MDPGRLRWPAAHRREPDAQPRAELVIADQRQRPGALQNPGFAHGHADRYGLCRLHLLVYDGKAHSHSVDFCFVVDRQKTLFAMISKRLRPPVPAYPSRYVCHQRRAFREVILKETVFVPP